MPLASPSSTERKAAAAHGYANRVVWVFFVVSFFVASVLFVVLAAIPSYFTYLKLYEADPASPALGLFGLIWAAVKDSFSLANVTQFTSANAINPFGWFLSLKGATLFSAGGEGVYNALNAQFNLAQAHGFIDICNGRFFKGLKKIITKREE